MGKSKFGDFRDLDVWQRCKDIMDHLTNYLVDYLTN
jgi:hypothetical protein